MSKNIKYFSNGPLPIQFEKRAIFDEDGTEWALYKNDAIEYLNWCIEKNLIVLGFDLAEPEGVVYPWGESGNAQEMIEIIQSANLDEVKKEIGVKPAFNIWVDKSWLEILKGNH